MPSVSLIPDFDDLEDDIWDFLTDDIEMRFWTESRRCVMLKFGECWDRTGVLCVGSDVNLAGPEGGL